MEQRSEEPELADEIRKKMFVFKILSLAINPSESAQEVDNNDLAVALKQPVKKYRMSSLIICPSAWPQ